MRTLRNWEQSVGRRTSIRSNLPSRVLEHTLGRPFVSGSLKDPTPGQGGSAMQRAEIVVSGQSFGPDICGVDVYGVDIYGGLGESNESEEEIHGFGDEGSHLVQL